MRKSSRNTSPEVGLPLTSAPESHMAMAGRQAGAGGSRYLDINRCAGPSDPGGDKQVLTEQACALLRQTYPVTGWVSVPPRVFLRILVSGEEDNFVSAKESSCSRDGEHVGLPDVRSDDVTTITRMVREQGAHGPTRGVNPSPWEGPPRGSGMHPGPRRRAISQPPSSTFSEKRHGDPQENSLFYSPVPRLGAGR